MRIRIKFTKEESVRFLGHLDIMRFFQKCFNRADIKMIYSEGFNPHQKMSFALPLSLGISSKGEYLDAVVADGQDPEDICARLNKVTGDGFRILAVRQLEESEEKAMAAVKYASYRVNLEKSDLSVNEITDGVNNLLKLDTYIITKKTKKQIQDVNIRPLIIDLHAEGFMLDMLVTAGSENNLKCEAVVDTIFKIIGKAYNRSLVSMCRIDLMNDRKMGL